MTRSIMIVEDEPELAALVADYARAAGYAPLVCADGLAALAAIRAQPPALVVLDLMLPGLDGLSLCRELRAFSAVPVLMITARVEESDRLLGLELGADDYLCKPFSPRELMARIKAILRRSSAGVTAPRALAIDEAARRAVIHGQALELTPSEFAILAALARRPGQALSRAQLLDAARADSLEATDRAIDSHIKNLRRKIEAAAPGLDAIGSVYGLGYRCEL
ncbi:response regulator [Massilia sp. H6]|uniref:response regulator n=1 Tax=Massilia sp. H6 TaxID=2970464 RepID=UPI00216A69B2|nr:response regulator [Massilia sp. H6]UVW27671.1 response regulator [Massilia sp. H6]